VESTADNTDSFKSIDQVSNAWNSKKIKLSPSIGMQSFSDDAAAANYDIHNMTGVDKLHAAGIYGKGAVVAIVDTGTYYTHPAVDTIVSLAIGRC
jgi:subtilisin family serine protease